MHLYGLVIQIFMAASFIAGITMLVFTIGYRHRLRRVERLGRYVLSTLLVYSVVMRFLLLLPGEFPYSHLMSIGFDIFYVTLCLFYNITILSRKDNDNESRRYTNGK
jgi:hypothetical protein